MFLCTYVNHTIFPYPNLSHMKDTKCGPRKPNLNIAPASRSKERRFAGTMLGLWFFDTGTTLALVSRAQHQCNMHVMLISPRENVVIPSDAGYYSGYFR